MDQNKSKPNKPNKPKIRPPRKRVDIILESVAIVAMISGIILVLMEWSNLPQTIPTHFNAKGEADGWGPKSMIWLLPAISIVMIPLMLLLRRFPWLSNIPVKITDENASYQYGLIVRLMSLLACVVSLLFLALLYDTISIAGGGSSLLGSWFMFIFVGGVVGSLLWYFIAMMKGRCTET